MRNLLALFAVLLLTFCGVGWWRAWYSVDTQPSLTGRIAFRVEIDVIKISTDAADTWTWATKAKSEDETKKSEEPKKKAE
jgi:hypothetical protein